ncbi:MAG: methionine adenosyltransferase domain-containing protein [Candidatus Nomurabacteria bacterium]|nr:methionine adenosyltransferase domain-containing protein [Candidatus Nomurabacteria bacterium]
MKPMIWSASENDSADERNFSNQKDSSLSGKNDVSVLPNGQNDDENNAAVCHPESNEGSSRKVSIYRTAESVSPHHPDKMCDQISDAILDAHLRQDPDARVAVDCCGGHNLLYITGEISSRAENISIGEIARRIAGENLKIIENVVRQSPEIARGVDSGGAGDQGIMIGYATDETSELMPLETILARRLCQKLYAVWPFDGKTQITLADGKIAEIVASFQNAKADELEKQVEKFLVEQTLAPVIDQPKIFANPAGDWQIGGFDADSGLTGRKLAVDNYGPRIALGGGAFSGKDGSKVDRSAAYMARKIAVDKLREIKKSKCCENEFAGRHEVLVRLSYAIGRREPLEQTIIVDGKPEKISADYDLTPRGIIDALNLKKPGFEKAARWGHFGEGFGWDK